MYPHPIWLMMSQIMFMDHGRGRQMIVKMFITWRHNNLLRETKRLVSRRRSSKALIYMKLGNNTASDSIN